MKLEIAAGLLALAEALPDGTPIPVPSEVLRELLVQVGAAVTELPADRMLTAEQVERCSALSSVGSTATQTTRRETPLPAMHSVPPRPPFASIWTAAGETSLALRPLRQHICCHA